MFNELPYTYCSYIVYYKIGKTVIRRISTGCLVHASCIFWMYILYLHTQSNIRERDEWEENVLKFIKEDDNRVLLSSLLSSDLDDNEILMCYHCNSLRFFCFLFKKITNRKMYTILFELTSRIKIVSISR